MSLSLSVIPEVPAYLDFTLYLVLFVLLFASDGFRLVRKSLGCLETIANLSISVRARYGTYTDEQGRGVGLLGVNTNHV